MADNGGKQGIDCKQLTAECEPVASWRPTWAEINLNALAENYRALTSLLSAGPGHTSKLFPVIKANAYGHGAGSIGKAMLEAGAIVSTRRPDASTS